MLSLSREFPKVKFLLIGCGELPDDQWRQIFISGKTQRCEGTIVFPPFKEHSRTSEHIGASLFLTT